MSQIQYNFNKNDEYRTPAYAVYPILKQTIKEKAQGFHSRAVISVRGFVNGNWNLITWIQVYWNRGEQIWRKKTETRK